MTNEMIPHPREPQESGTILDAIERVIASLKPEILREQVMTVWNQLAPSDRLEVQSSAALASTPEDPYGVRTATELLLLIDSDNTPN